MTACTKASTAPASLEGTRRADAASAVAGCGLFRRALKNPHRNSSRPGCTPTRPMARRMHCQSAMSLRGSLGFAWSGVICATMALSSCAAATTIPVHGAPEDLFALTGEWRGTYTSPDLNREGTIWIRLVGGEDHAHGDVRMTPRGRTEPYQPYDTGNKRTPVPPQFLSIRFVRVSADDVEGVLDPYWDPDYECVATTTFRGQRQGDRLQGSFETRLTTGTTVTGRWRVDRRIAR